MISIIAAFVEQSFACVSHAQQWKETFCFVMCFLCFFFFMEKILSTIQIN